MGYTVSGTVFYGIPLGGDEDGFEFPWDDDEEEWQDIWAKKIGIKKPDRDDFKSDDDYYKQLEPYWRETFKISDESVCDIAFSGYDGFYTHYIEIKESGVESQWGEIVPLSPETKPEWDAQLKHFCEFLGLPYSQPKWYVTCRMF